MIRATLTGDEAVRNWLAAIPAKAEAGLLGAATALTDRLYDIAESNLSGDVLKAQTGTLRASLQAQTDQTGAGIAATVTATAPYAAFQEYGFAGTEDVRTYLRRQTMAFGHPITPVTASVRAYERRVDYPGRSFLRTALSAVAPGIEDALRSALVEAAQ